MKERPRGRIMPLENVVFVAGRACSLTGGTLGHLHLMVAADVDAAEAEGDRDGNARLPGETTDAIPAGRASGRLAQR